MENKNMTLSLGGQERVLKFSKVGLLRHLGDILGDFDIMDPQVFTRPTKAYKCVFYLVWAGLLASGEKDLTEERVQEWVDDLDQEVMRDIQYRGFSAMTGKSVEELKNLEAQAMNGIAKVL